METVVGARHRPVMTRPDWSRYRSEDGLLDLVAAALCLAALWHSVAITSGVSWPADPDQFRDLAQAQTMLNGFLLGDPFYRGETLWYNPFTGAFIAALSALSGALPHVVHVTSGPFINLLAPIALYVFMVLSFGRPAALMTLLGFFALDPSLAYISASYSPWLFPATIGQGLFFVALAILVAVRKRVGRVPVLVSGVILGVVFLCHTAPAVVLGGVIAAVIFTGHGIRGWRPALAQLVAAMFIAALVASPLLYSIVGRYGLDIVHPHPSLWQEEAVQLDRFWGFLRDHLLRIKMLPMAAGIAVLFRHRRQIGTVIVAAWGVASVAGLAYSYLWQWLIAAGINAPAIIPGFHFFRYVKLVENVLFGLGWVVAFDALRGLVQPRVQPLIWQWASRVAVTSVLLGLFVVSYPGYVSRRDFTDVRDSSRLMYTGPDQLALSQWIREQPERDAIFAAPNNVSLSIIGPAGGRVLAVDPFFSNPYIDFQSRHTARNTLITALAREECETVRTIAVQFDVTYIVADTGTIPIAASTCGLDPVFSGTAWRVFRLPQWFLSQPR